MNPYVQNHSIFNSTDSDLDANKPDFFIFYFFSGILLFMCLYCCCVEYLERKSESNNKIGDYFVLEKLSDH